MSAVPTVEVYKGDAKARINVSDLAEWKRAGWSDQKPQLQPAPVKVDKPS